MADPRHDEYDRLLLEVLEEGFAGDVDDPEYQRKRRRLEQLRRQSGIPAEDIGDE